MPMIPAPHDAAAACLFNGFSDPTRLAILRQLSTGEKRVGEIAEALGLAQSTVSQQLGCLRGCDLVISRTEGRSTLHSLAHEQAMMDLFASADRLLGLTDEAVVLCPTFGIGGVEAAGVAGAGAAS